MTPEDIAQLEQATGLSLPERYRETLQNYPQSLLDLAEIYPQKKGKVVRIGPESNELYRNKQDLWHQNVDGKAYKAEIFPEWYFIIGDSGCGDLYAIDTRNPAAPVFMSGPHESEYPKDEQGHPKPVSPSLDHWIERLQSGNAP